MQVKFVASPVWKGRGSVGGGGVRRSVLKVLPANSRNSKLLVGQGSPRLPSFGKNAKTPLPHEVVSCGVYVMYSCTGTCMINDNGCVSDLRSSLIRYGVVEGYSVAVNLRLTKQAYT